MGVLTGEVVVVMDAEDAVVAVMDVEDAVCVVDAVGAVGVVEDFHHGSTGH